MKDNSNISQELLEIIERYLKGGLNSQELNDFNRLLEIDDEFKTQVDDVKTILLGIENQSQEAQQDEFREGVPENQPQQHPTLQKKHFQNYSKIAATVAITIAIGSIWFFSRNPNQNLYAKYFKPDPGLPTTMSATDDFAFYDGMVYYKHGDYGIAISKWQVLSEDDPENDTLNYFMGVAHLANKNVADAIPFLERAAEAEDDFPFLGDAYYYLGLAYIKEGNKELAKKHLNMSNTEKGKEIVTKLID